MTKEEKHKAICKVLGETYAPNEACQIGSLADRLVDAEYKLVLALELVALLKRET